MTSPASRSFRLALLVVACASLAAPAARADETCNSPYMTGLIKGQEDFVHVWTLGVKGMGDESDKLVTIDARFVEATGPSQVPIPGGDGQGWWRWRVPSRLEGELRSDLEAERILKDRER